MKVLDIYQLVDALSDEDDTVTIYGDNFFNLCLELEKQGIGYEFSELSLLRLEAQFKTNIEVGKNYLKIHYSDDFRRAIRILNQHNLFGLTKDELKIIWQKISR